MPLQLVATQRETIATIRKPFAIKFVSARPASMVVSVMEKCYHLVPKDWSSIICSAVHAILACHAFVTSAAAFNPHISGQRSHVSTVSKRRYQSSTRLSLVLSSVGAAIAAAGPGFTVDHVSTCIETENQESRCAWPQVSDSNQDCFGLEF